MPHFDIVHEGQKEKPFRRWKWLGTDGAFSPWLRQSRRRRSVFPPGRPHDEDGFSILPTYFSTSPVRFLTPPNKNEKRNRPPFHASPRLNGCKILSSSPAEWLSLSTKTGIGAICARKQREAPLWQLPQACPTVEPPGRTLLFSLLDPKFLLSL